MWHSVKLKDFSQPRLIRYDPNSDDEELSNPKINFTIEDVPSVSEEFELGFELYSLDSNNSLGGNEWRVSSSGNHIVEWNELFPPEEVTPFAKGIYAFDLTIRNRGLKANVLRDNGILNSNGMGIYSTAEDQKVNRNLHIHEYRSDLWYHPRSPNVWSLSYDENSGKTRLSYTVDIWNQTAYAVDKEPQNVRVYVYDTDLNKIGEITNQTRERSFSEYDYTDGVFTYYFDGEVNLDTLGDYYFVVVAQTSSKEEDSNSPYIYDNKDVGKWAIEQGVTFSLKIDIDMDVDNTTLSGYPNLAKGDRSDKEEADEQTKFVRTFTNLMDADDDGVPGYADGIDKFGNGQPNSCWKFEPMVIEIPMQSHLPDAQVVFRYSASDPDAMTSEGTAPLKRYTPAPGVLRIWKKDGDQVRSPLSVSNGGDFVREGQAYTLAQLGFEASDVATLYVEAVDWYGFNEFSPITVEFYPGGLASGKSARTNPESATLLHEQRKPWNCAVGRELRVSFGDKP